jgi:hypothetical protein
VNYLLIDEMSEERRRSYGHRFVVSLESLPELNNQALDQQLSALGKFRVDDRNHGCINGGERQTGCLRLHDRPAEQAATTDQVLSKQLWHNLLDICRVALVNHALYRLLQCLPRHALVFRTRFVGDGSLHRAESRRWNIRATGARLGVVYGELALGVHGFLKLSESGVLVFARGLRPWLASRLFWFSSISIDIRVVFTEAGSARSFRRPFVGGRASAFSRNGLWS